MGGVWESHRWGGSLWIPRMLPRLWIQLFVAMDWPAEMSGNEIPLQLLEVHSLRKKNANQSVVQICVPKPCVHKTWILILKTQHFWNFRSLWFLSQTSTCFETLVPTHGRNLNALQSTPSHASHYGLDSAGALIVINAVMFAFEAQYRARRRSVFGGWGSRCKS